MKKRLLTLVFTLALLIALLGCLFGLLRGLVDDREYYAARYAALGIQSATGISTEECTTAVYRLVEYMEGRVDSIQLTVTENGRRVDMYNEQEILHMLDVRALYQGFRVLMWAGFGLFALLLCLCIWRPTLWPILGKAFLYAWGVLLCAVLLCGVWVLVDFNSFWTGFHRLFFRNELWLMDPRVCRMIRICPIELFYGIVTGLGLRFLLLCGALPGLLLLALGRIRKKKVTQ